MPGRGRIFYVAGAGIAGLTLALALAKFGAHVVVLEKSGGLSEFGAGLQISPNARKVLDGLGLSEAIAAASIEPQGIDLCLPGRERPLVTLALGEAMRARFGAPYAVMHRADLGQVLLRATRRFANIDVVFTAGNWQVEQGERGVSVSFAGRSGRADAFIGADGVHSPTRRKLLGGPEASYVGKVAWRALLPLHRLAGVLAEDRVTVLFGRAHHAVCYPLPHRGQMNLALFAAAPLPGAPAVPPVNPGRDQRLAQILAQEADWTSWPLYTVEAPTWSRGAVGLVGDAAHAMLPFQAQGAAMAIEDAAVLAPLLVQHSATEAFERYEKLRRARVERVARTSQANGRIFHMGWPGSMARNVVIRASGPLGQLRRLGWLYGYDVT
jgi:salicylate hydroxylase